MPFGIGHHKNRSKSALNDPPPPPAAAGPGAGLAPDAQIENNNHHNNNNSGSASPRANSSQQSFPSHADDSRSNQQSLYQQQQQQQHTSTHPDSQQQQQQQHYPNPSDLDRRPYHPAADVPPPARSQSTRYSVGSAYQQQQHYQLLQSQGSGSVDNLVLDARNDSRKEHPLPPPPADQLQQQPPPQSSSKKSNFFNRLRSSKDSKSTPPQAVYNNTSGISRRLSRRLENQPAVRSPQPPSASEQQRLDWQAAQDSRTHLPSPQEDHEDDVDPYQIRPGQDDNHSAPPSAISEHNSQTIRPVQSEFDQGDYDDSRPPPPPAHAQHVYVQQPSDPSSPVDYQYQQPQHHQVHPQGLQPGNIITADPYHQQNPETVSQRSYDSPINDTLEEQQRPSSHSNGHSPTSYPGTRQDYPDRNSGANQGTRPISSQFNNSTMPQSGAQQQGSRRDPTRQPPMQGNQGQADSRDGPPPNYSRQGFTGNQNQQPPTPGLPTQGSTASNYRGGPPQREQSQTPGGGEQGRSTPPPAASGDRSVEDNYKELLVKYKKVKGLYFDKTAQVEQLQNTLANQRLSQSRTSLDDSEYMTRFNRLDGAIMNLAFNIRKDWRTIPSWLATSCNQDAVKIGKQEMTGVGRACITKFIVDEVFYKIFHPSLDPLLSQNLKAIERNIRRFASTINNQEESEALTSKVVNWRLATLEGLKDQLTSPQAEEHKEDFLRVTTTKLCASLIQHLQEVPGGIEDIARTIIELAVSIAANMPLESRDIHVFYPAPGDTVQSSLMKVETGIPPLENPCEEGGDESSTGSAEKEEKESDKATDGGKLRKEKSKQSGGILGGLIGSSNSSSGGKKPDGPSEPKNKPPAGIAEERVRFAGFVGAEVRGRQVLMKAPVWTTN